MQEIVVDSAKLHDFARTLCEKAGLRPEDGETIAKHQVLTDLRGVHSHGTRALPGYLNLVLDGKMNPQPELSVATEGPSFAVVDGDNGMGHLASTFAMATAIEKAKTTGIAAAGVRNAGHFGAAACYAIMAASSRMVGFSTTNTGGASIVAPRRCRSRGRQQRHELRATYRRWASDCVGYGVWCFRMGEDRHAPNVWQTDSRRMAHRRNRATYQ